MRLHVCRFFKINISTFFRFCANAFSLDSLYFISFKRFNSVALNDVIDFFIFNFSVLQAMWRQLDERTKLKHMNGKVAVPRTASVSNL